MVSLTALQADMTTTLRHLLLLLVLIGGAAAVGDEAAAAAEGGVGAVDEDTDYGLMPATTLLLEAFSEVVEVTPQNSMHLLVQQPELASVLVEILLTRGITSYVYIPSSFRGTEHDVWSKHVSQGRYAYYNHNQFIVWGDREFIMHTIAKANKLYLAGRLSAIRTHWIWILQPTYEVSLIEKNHFEPMKNKPFIINLPLRNNALSRIFINCDSPGKKSESSGNLSSGANNTSSSTPCAVPAQTISAIESAPHDSLPLEKVTQSVFKGQLEKTIFFGTRGVLLLITVSNAPINEKSFSKYVSVLRVRGFPERGSVLQIAARYRGKGEEDLEIIQEIWPLPIRNFNLASITIPYINKPTVFMLPDGVNDLDKATGYCSELLQEMVLYMNFTPNFYKTAGFGTMLKNGTWKGMVGELSRRSGEMSPLDFTSTSIRMRVVDFSFPFGMDSLVTISQASEILIRPFLLLQIFSPVVFVVLVVLGLMVGLLVTLMARLEVKVGAVPEDEPVTAFLPVGLKWAVYQACDPLPRGNAARIVSLFALVTSLIIVAIYSGSITAFLAIPFRSSPINTAGELVDSNMQLYVRAGTYTLNFFNQQNTGHGNTIKQRLKLVTPAGLGEWDFFSRVADGTAALIDTLSSCTGRAKKFEKPNQRCLFHVSYEAFRSDTDVWAYNRNSKVSYHMDNGLRWLTFYGIAAHIRRKHFQTTCVAEVSSTELKPMGINQSQGVVYVYFGGMLISILAFFGELLFHRMYKKQDNDNVE